MKKLRSRLFITICAMCFTIYPVAAHAQERLTIDAYCQYAGDPLPEDVYGFESEAAAQAAVKRVVDFTGLAQNFTIRAANVPNAAAVISGQSRQILYNQAFMLEVAKVERNWAAISIMAHEVGHHLNGHTITSGGSRPSIELEADRYSGYVLQRMGATLDQAKAAMNQIASEAGSTTHPPKSARLAAITNGWIASRDTKAPTAPEGSTGPQPQSPEPATPGPSTPNFVARVVFPSENVLYYVTADQDILAIAPGASPVLVGKRVPPTLPGFAWMYHTAVITYGVTPTGQVMSRNQFGQFFQVGFVTNP